MENNLLTRYSEITEKNKREIVLLRGSGCKWRRCSFCDYHLDFSPDPEENFTLNKEELLKVTGKYKKLEIVNSGSFVDLDEKTFALITDICCKKGIKELHFECHWMHRHEIQRLKNHFKKLGITVKIKIGVETFNADFRENILFKGIDEKDPEIISEAFDEVCLLFGISGQNESSMRFDVETGLKYFERVCINIMEENSTKIKPDKNVIDTFLKNIYHDYKNNPRVDILINNTDFGIG